MAWGEAPPASRLLGPPPLQSGAPRFGAVLRALTYPAPSGRSVQSLPCLLSPLTITLQFSALYPQTQ